MKTIRIEEFSAAFGDLVSAALEEKVLVTRQGKPLVVVTDVSRLDEEEIGYVTSPAFWRMIEERRREPTVPLEVIEARLAVREAEIKSSPGVTRLKKPRVKK